jgi:hypothetical protein
MDDTPDVTITYTSHRYWRIIFPLFALLIIIEYIVIFFYFPASTDLGIIKSYSNSGFNFQKMINSRYKVGK